MSGPLSPSSILREFQSHGRQQGRQQHNFSMPTITETASQVRVMQRSGSNNNNNSSLSSGVSSAPLALASAMQGQASAFSSFKGTWTPLAIGVCVIVLIALVGGTGYYLWVWFSERKKSAAAKVEHLSETIKRTNKQQSSEEEQQKTALLLEENAAEAQQQIKANQLRSQLDQVKAQYLAQAQMAEEQRLASQREIQHLRQQLQYQQSAHMHQMTGHVLSQGQAPSSQVQTQAPTLTQPPSHEVHDVLKQHAAEDQDMSMDDLLPENAAQQEPQAEQTQHGDGGSESDDFMVI